MGNYVLYFQNKKIHEVADFCRMGRVISKLRADAKWGSAFFECLSLDLKAEFSGQT